METPREKSASWLDSLAVRSAVVLALLFGLMFAVGTGLLWYLHQPIWIALLFAFAIVFGQYLIAPWLLDRLFKINWALGQTMGAEFDGWMHQSCAKLGISQPRFGIIQDGNPNAFTYGHHKRDARVVVTSGLLDMLTPEEVRAVVAHELEHIAHNDFIVMTVAQSVPLVLYIFYTWTRERARDGAGALAVSIGAYATYIASQFVVLSLSRVREFFADEGAGELTRDPNALATALVKISYGMAPRADQTAYEAAQAAHKDKSSKVKPTKPRELGAASALGICNIDAAGTFAISAANASGQFDAGLMQRAAQWDLKNPWAKWYEINSTHPLTARRLSALSQQAKRMGQTPAAQIESDPRLYKGQFWLEFLTSALPWGLGAIGYLGGLYWFGEGMTSWSPAIAAYGLGLLIKTKVAYPHLRPGKREITSLIGEELEASGINGVPCEIEGTIVGRGVPGLFWSKDLVIRDESGFLTLQYRQPFLILELLFGVLKAQRFVGQSVRVRGWYRRAPVPYLEVHSINSLYVSDKVRCYFHQGTLFWSVFFLTLGLWATATHTNVAHALWSAILFVVNVFK
jgi:heat shock protein HtpX